MYISKNCGGNPNVDDILISKHNNKIVHQTPPKKDHDNRWLFKKTLMIIILQVKDVSNPKHGQVHSIIFHSGMMMVTYEMTIWVIWNYTCHDFVYMLSNLKNKGKFIPCKHMYFIYKTKMFCNHKINDLINWPTMNINEVKKLSQQEVDHVR